MQKSSICRKIVVFICFWVPTAWGMDASCNNPDAACIEDSRYELKLKRFFNIDLDTFSGVNIVNGGMLPTVDGKIFCIVNYRPRSNFQLREMYPYSLRLNGLNKASPAVLKKAQREDLPVRLKLKGQSLATLDQDENLSDGNFVTQKSYNLAQNCKDYSFVIEAYVDREDVLTKGAVGVYENTFNLLIDGDINNELDLDGDFVISKPFTVKVEITPALQVSQLRDVGLDNKKLSDVMKFCVFSLEGGNYKLSLSSQYRPNQLFTLQDNGGASRIPYTVSVGGVNYSAATGDILRSGASKVLECGGIGNTNEEITIQVTMGNASLVPAGTYTDVMEVTVGPE